MDKKIEQHLEREAGEYTIKFYDSGGTCGNACDDIVDGFKAGAKAAYEIGRIFGRMQAYESTKQHLLADIEAQQLSEMLGRG